MKQLEQGKQKTIVHVTPADKNHRGHKVNHDELVLDLLMLGYLMKWESFSIRAHFEAIFRL